MTKELREAAELIKSYHEDLGEFCKDKTKPESKTLSGTEYTEYKIERVAKLKEELQKLCDKSNDPTSESCKYLQKAVEYYEKLEKRLAHEPATRVNTAMEVASQQFYALKAMDLKNFEKFLDKEVPDQVAVKGQSNEIASQAVAYNGTTTSHHRQ